MRPTLKWLPITIAMVLGADSTRAQEGAWTLWLLGGGAQVKGDALAIWPGSPFDGWPPQCGPQMPGGSCWQIQGYAGNDTQFAAGLGLGFRPSRWWGVELTLLRSRVGVDADRVFCNSGDFMPPSCISDHSTGTLSLVEGDLAVNFHVLRKGPVSVFGGPVAGRLWPGEVTLYGATREVRGANLYGAQAGIELVSSSGRWRASLRVRKVRTRIEIEEIDPMHEPWARVDLRLGSALFGVGYTF